MLGERRWRRWRRWKKIAQRSDDKVTRNGAWRRQKIVLPIGRERQKIVLPFDLSVDQ